MGMDRHEFAEAHAHSRKRAYDKLSRFVTRRVWRYVFCDLTPGLTTNELQTMVKRIEKRAMERRNRGAVHFNSEMNNTLFLSRRIDEG